MIHQFIVNKRLIIIQIQNIFPYQENYINQIFKYQFKDWIIKFL
jgi:hypothetical protein